MKNLYNIGIQQSEYNFLVVASSEEEAIKAWEKDRPKVRTISLKYKDVIVGL